MESASGSDVFSSFLLSNLGCCHQIQNYNNGIHNRINQSSIISVLHSGSLIFFFTHWCDLSASSLWLPNFKLICEQFSKAAYGIYQVSVLSDCMFWLDFLQWIQNVFSLQNNLSYFSCCITSWIIICRSPWRVTKTLLNHIAVDKSKAEVI